MLEKVTHLQLSLHSAEVKNLKLSPNHPDPDSNRDCIGHSWDLWMELLPEMQGATLLFRGITWASVSMYKQQTAILTTPTVKKGR